MSNGGAWGMNNHAQPPRGRKNTPEHNAARRTGGSRRRYCGARGQVAPAPPPPPPRRRYPTPRRSRPAGLRGYSPRNHLGGTSSRAGSTSAASSVPTTASPLPQAEPPRPAPGGAAAALPCSAFEGLASPGRRSRLAQELGAAQLRAQLSLPTPADFHAYRHDRGRERHHGRR